MVGIVKVDTLQNNAGTSSVDMGYVVNGSAKAWAKFNSSAALADSFNIASTVDVGTGQWRFAKTNSMSSTEYTVVGTNGDSINNFATGHNSNAVESSANHTQSKYDPVANVFQDFASGGFGMHNVHGDLA